MSYKIGSIEVIKGLYDVNGADRRKNFSLNQYGLVHNALGSVSGNVTIDLTLGNYISATITGNVTWTFSNPVTGGMFFILRLINGGAGTNNWPNSVKWPGGTAPTFTTSGTDFVFFITDDSGTTWRGCVSMIDVK